MRSFAFGLILVLLGPLSADLAAQTTSGADSLFRAGDWQAAAEAYRGLVARDSTSGQAWFRLGIALRNLGRWPDAVQALQRADTLGFQRIAAQYNIARGYAHLGDRDRALDWLSRAVAGGFSQPSTLRSDSSFIALREDSRFDSLAARADRNARPCEYDPVYDQFDFWVGDWDVYVPSGQKAGTNHIEKIVQSCVLLENWTSAAGNVGKSFNYYDPITEKWVQVWVDQGGDVITMEGGLQEGGAMHFEGVHHYAADGHTEQYRMTYTPNPDGTVRQFIEESRDAGASWYVWFDGKYVRQNEAGSRSGS